MDNLATRILDLMARLSGREGPEPTSPPPLNRAAIETAYRQALRRWFKLAAQGPDADREEVERIYQDILRLIDEVGEPRATALRRQWARSWHQETGICPFCGVRGPYHDPDEAESPPAGRLDEPLPARPCAPVLSEALRGGRALTQCADSDNVTRVVGLADIEAARQALAGVIYTSPCAFSETLSQGWVVGWPKIAIELPRLSLKIIASPLDLERAGPLDGETFRCLRLND